MPHAMAARLALVGDLRLGRSARRGQRPPAGWFLCYIIQVDRVVRWYRTARRHRVGKAHTMHVITTTTPVQVPASDVADARRVWIGVDDRGIELEIVALDLADASWSSTSCPPA